MSIKRSFRTTAGDGWCEGECWWTTGLDNADVHIHVTEDKRGQWMSGYFTEAGVCTKCSMKVGDETHYWPASHPGNHA